MTRVGIWTRNQSCHLVLLEEQHIHGHCYTRGGDCPVKSGANHGSLIERTKQPFLLREEEVSQPWHFLDVGTGADH